MFSVCQPSAAFLRTDVVPRYVMNGLRKPDETYIEYSISPATEQNRTELFTYVQCVHWMNRTTTVVDVVHV